LAAEESIQELAKQHNLPLEDLGVVPEPFRLLLDPVFPFFQEDDNVELEKVASAVLGDLPKDLRDRAPLYCTRGAPGTGKTRFIDELAKKCRTKHSPDCPVLCLSITFNGRMPYNRDVLPPENLQSETSLRILYCFLKGTDFLAFRSWISQDRPIKLVSVLEAILLRCGFIGQSSDSSCTLVKPKVVLCIDEIGLTGNIEQVLDILTSSQLNIHERYPNVTLNLFVTALDGFYPSTIRRTLSNRQLKWVKLNQLQPVSRVKKELFTDAIWRENSALSMLIDEAGGHPRTLSLLHQTLPKFMELGVTSPYWAFVDRFNTACETFISLFQNSSYPFNRETLAPAILAEDIAPISVGKVTILRRYGTVVVIPDTYLSIVGAGLFVNPNLGTSSPFRPELSLLAFSNWVHQHQTEDSWFYCLSLLLSSPLSLIFPEREVDYLGGEPFESWHVYWEAVARTVRSSISADFVDEIADAIRNCTIPEVVLAPYPITREVEWSRHYKGATQLSVGPGSHERLTGWEPILFKFGDCNRFGHFCTLIATNSPFKNNLDPRKINLTPLEAFTSHKRSIIFTMGKTFPRYDTVIFDPVSVHDWHVTLLQCKYSDEQSRTELDEATVLTVLKGIKKEWEPFLTPSLSEPSSSATSAFLSNEINWLQQQLDIKVQAAGAPPPPPKKSLPDFLTGRIAARNFLIVFVCLRKVREELYNHFKPGSGRSQNVLILASSNLKDMYGSFWPRIRPLYRKIQESQSVHISAD